MLIRIERRKDARPAKRKEKPPIPNWAILDDGAKELPKTMFFPPSMEELEECILYDRAIPYREVKVKGIPIVDVPIAYLDI